ncbi:hypothetical protein RR46_00029 [Papilio xuthus]|uniref:Uncharacterized protein n=1 Tax=Papilio xuthus TaxID=66420 RepID=A0A0N0PEY8_PAPXU|nr:hypothetical protein RR46_00029 [Papilio xuthus]
MYDKFHLNPYIDIYNINTIIFQRSSSSLCVLNVGRNALGCDAVRVLAEGGLGALLSLGLQAARLGPDAGRPLAALLAAGQLQVH